MNFIDAIRICFVKYVDFTGRAPAAEYWYFALFGFIAGICLSIVYAPLGIAFDLAILLPDLAVAVRRLHDFDRSGWWLLLGLIPIIGWIVLLIWYCKPSDPLPNRFGDPPLPV
jgi:uncharacterized membrane protein YhaH (DUF805 family)